MIFGNKSISQYTPHNVAIWMVLALQAGMLNAGGFLGCHRFVSHITGFATHLGIEISVGDYAEAVGMLVVPLFFLFGAMVSGLVVDLRIKLDKRPNYYISFGIIFLLIGFVFVGGQTGYFGTFGEPLEQSRAYTLLVLLCFTCGIQNGTITTVSRSIVRTTHLTGVATDLGIGIIRILNRKRLSLQAPDEGRANLMRVGIILFFTIGSVVGAVIFKQAGYLGFAIPFTTSGVLFALMFYFQVLRPTD